MMTFLFQPIFVQLFNLSGCNIPEKINFISFLISFIIHNVIDLTSVFVFVFRLEFAFVSTKCVVSYCLCWLFAPPANGQSQATCVGFSSDSQTGNRPPQGLKIRIPQQRNTCRSGREVCVQNKFGISAKQIQL